MRQTPRSRGWVWGAGRNIGGDGTAWEEPDANVVRGPLHCEDTTTILVEARTVSVGSRIEDSTTRVVVFLQKLDLKKQVSSRSVRTVVSQSLV